MPHSFSLFQVEDIEVLRQRQELQQSKSIHELSKIGNMNEIPLPFKVPLPDIPLVNPFAIFKPLKGGNKKSANKGSGEMYQSEHWISTVGSQDTIFDTHDADMLR